MTLVLALLLALVWPAGVHGLALAGLVVTLVMVLVMALIWPSCGHEEEDED